MLLPLLLVAATAAELTGGLLSEEELAKALAGETPVRSETFTATSGKSTGRGLGAIVVDKPASAAFAVLSRYEDKAEYMPRLDRVTVHEKTPTSVRATMEIDASLTTVKYTGLFSFDPEKLTISWVLDPATPEEQQGIDETEGGWHIFPLSESRTLLVYWAFVDSGRAVPKFIQRQMSVRSIPDLLRNVKSRIESDGTWKKE